MNLDDNTVLILVGVVVVFFLFREVHTWYWKINAIIRELEAIKGYLSSLERTVNNQQVNSSNTAIKELKAIKGYLSSLERILSNQQVNSNSIENDKNAASRNSELNKISFEEELNEEEWNEAVVETVEAVVPDKNAQNFNPPFPTHSIAYKLLKLEELLDEGSITVDEFNAQKDQLMKML